MAKVTKKSEGKLNGYWPFIIIFSLVTSGVVIWIDELTIGLILYFAGFGIGLYIIWYIATHGGRYPLFYTRSYYRDLDKKIIEEQEQQKKVREDERNDLAKKIANEIKN